MNFAVKRYKYSLKKRSKWLLCAFVPVLGYLLASGLIADRFSAEQDLRISQDAPVSVMDSPVDFMRLKDFVLPDAGFFSDDFTLVELSKKIDMEGGMRGDADQSNRALRAVVLRGMSLRLLDENTVRVYYEGENSRLGESLVDFYAKKVVERAEEGLARTTKPLAAQWRGAGASEGAGSVKAASGAAPGSVKGEANRPAEIKGPQRIREHRSLWRSERLVPAVVIFLVSLLFCLVLVGMLEWMDPAFKSERQVARYLEVPILGALPDLNKFMGKMRSGSSTG